MNDIKSRFGKHLKHFRLMQGMTQQQLAEQADMSISFLGNIERGNKSPTIETLQKLATALNISLGELVEFEDKTGQKLEKDLQIRRILCECVDRILQIYEQP